MSAATPPERSRFQQGVIRRHYEHFDANSLQRLSEIVSEIYIAEANKPVKLWERVKGLLARVAAEDPRIAQIIAKKDIQALARLVNELSAGLKEKKSGVKGQTSPTTTTQVPHDDATQSTELSSGAQTTASVTDVLSAENLKRAMKAFRKRLKLTRLDDESRLGRSSNPMTGGKHSQVVAIMAPREFPQAVWDELVKQGQLKRSGAFYALAAE